MAQQWLTEEQTRPSVTLDSVLYWLPPWIVQDFNCVRGPHEWLSTQVNLIGSEGVMQFCKHCPAKRRIMEAA